MSIARLAPAAPLLSGFTLPVRHAAAVGGVGAFVTMLVSAASGSRPPYVVVQWEWFLDPFGARIATTNVTSLVQSPAPIAVIVGWTIAAFVMSTACRNGRRSLALGGLAMGVAIIYAGYLLADILSRAFNASATWTGQTLLVSLMVSSILVVLVIAAGPPVRAEEE
jgi:hypothetical protein